MERSAGRRAGQLTPGWRAVVAATWALVFLAFTAAWKTSRELGLATWWLGPQGSPAPLVVTLLPFVAPALMVSAALNNVRRLPWLGLLASAVTAAIAAGDLARVTRLAAVELAVAAAGAAVSVASLAGVLRPVSADRPVRAAVNSQNREMAR